MQEQPLAVVDRNRVLKRTRNSPIDAGEQRGERIAAVAPPGVQARSAPAAAGRPARSRRSRTRGNARERRDRRSPRPKYSTRIVARSTPRPQVGAAAAPGVVPEPGPAGHEERDAGRRPDGQGPRRARRQGSRDTAQTARIGEQEPGVDLGQQGQRPERPPRPHRHGTTARTRGLVRPASRASVQKRLRKVSRAARWAWAKTRGMARSAQPAASPAATPHRRPLREATSADQEPRRPAPGPAGPRGRRARSGRPLAAGPRTARPASRRCPAASVPAAGARRCRGRPGRRRPRSKNRQPAAAQGRDVGAARPDVQRLVDGQSRVAQGQQDRQSGGQPTSRPGRRRRPGSRPLAGIVFPDGLPHRRVNPLSVLSWSSGERRLHGPRMSGPSRRDQAGRSAGPFKVPPGPAQRKPTSSSISPGREPGGGSSSSSPVWRSGSGRRVPRAQTPPPDQGSSAFFWEIRRRTRSASRAPSNGFLNASLKPSAKVSSPGSSLVRASRMVLWWSGLLRRFCAI